MPFFGGGGGDYHIVATNIKGGNQAAPAVTGTNNMALGNGALQSALNADNNIAVGNLALNAVTTGGNNLSVGYNSFPVLALGNFVVAVGGNTGAESTGSQESVIIGYGAFSSNFVQPHTADAAQQSVIIGTNAVPSGDVTGAVYIGASARQGNSALSTNVVVIGANALGLDSSVVIGAGATGDPNSIAIGLNAIAAANEIVIGDASYTSVQIGGITLASATGAVFPNGAIVGNAGTESTGITIGGVLYDSVLKVSDISSADIAESIIHRHSTTWEPIQVFARSNSNGTGHGAVVNGMLISSQYSAGWTGTEYNLFGRASFEAAATGTISDASSPGDFVIATTPDGGTVPVEAMRVKSDKSVAFNASVGTAGQVLTSGGAGAPPTWAAAGGVGIEGLGLDKIGYMSAVGQGLGTISVLGLRPASLTGSATGNTFGTGSVYAASRMAKITSTAGAGSTADVYQAAYHTSLEYGFDAIFRFAFADAAPVAGAQSFIGLVNSIFLGSVVPSSIVNMIGIGNDGADANMQIMHNDAAGVATKVDLGAGFPATTSATDVYELRLTTVSTTSVDYSVTNLTTGATTSGNISTNTPAAATPLTAYFTRNNNATALAVILAFSQFYINTPY